jgi:hypothetical protein
LEKCWDTWRDRRIGMISLETAKALKEAGLEWKPRKFDSYFHPNLRNALINDPHVPKCGIKPELIFVPRLDQLLKEIEKRGWEWELGILTLNDGRTYMIDVALEELIKTESEDWMSFVANSPEEAAAQALLWILNQK